MTKPKTDTTLKRFHYIQHLAHPGSAIAEPDLLDKDLDLPDFAPARTQDLTDSEFVLQDVTVLASTLKIHMPGDLRLRTLINCTVILDDDVSYLTCMGCHIVNASHYGSHNSIHISTLVDCHIQNNRSQLMLSGCNIINLKASNLFSPIRLSACALTVTGLRSYSMMGLILENECTGVANVTGLGEYGRNVHIILGQDLKPLVKGGCFSGTLRKFSKACAKKYGRGSAYSKVVHNLAKEVKDRYKPRLLALSLVERLLIERYLNKDNNLYECLAATRAGDHPGLFVVKPKPETGEPND